jgi:hypothetical protein
MKHLKCWIASAWLWVHRGLCWYGKWLSNDVESWKVPVTLILPIMSIFVGGLVEGIEFDRSPHKGSLLHGILRGALLGPVWYVGIVLAICGIIVGLTFAYNVITGTYRALTRWAEKTKKSC